MKAVDQLLLFLVGILALVAFLNHGNLGVGAEPKGATFNFGYGSR